MSSLPFVSALNDKEFDATDILMCKTSGAASSHFEVKECYQQDEVGVLLFLCVHL